jgi:hypothetical protein
MCLVLTCEKMFHAEVAEVSQSSSKNFVELKNHSLSAFAHALCTLRENVSRRVRRVHEEFVGLPRPSS